MSAHDRTLLSHLLRLSVPADPDATLLTRWIEQRDQQAFAALMARHGPMVLGVCRRLLGDMQEAEEVFQAVFLVLSRQASRLRQPESLPGFLHIVAVRLTRKLRRRQRMQTNRDLPEPIDPRPNPLDMLSGRELLALLDEEIARLSERYRLPLVLCLLQGRTAEEAARQLGWSLGSLRGRLTRGRERLRRQLMRRGLDLSVGAVALLAPVAVPEKMLAESLRHLSGPVPTAIRALADGMLPTLKLKILGLALILVTAVGLGAGLSLRSNPEPQTLAASLPAAPPPQVKDEPRRDLFGDPLPPGAVARLGTIRFRHEEVFSWQFAVSPDGQTIGTAAGRSLILWDMATGRARRRFSLDQAIRCLAFAPDGKSVAIGGEDCVVHRIDLASGKELQRFAGHQVGDALNFKGIWGVAFTSDGRKLISWGTDDTVRVWKVESGKELRRLSNKDFRSRQICGVSPDGKFLVASTWMDKQQPTRRLWNVETGKVVQQRWEPISGTAFSPDGKLLAIAEANRDRPNRIVLLDLESGKAHAASASQKHWEVSLTFSPDGKMLASVGFGQSKLAQSIRLWEVSSMKELRATPPLSGPYNSVSQLAFSPDGKTLISRSHENHVRLWDVASGKERTFAGGPSQGIHCLAFSPNAKLAASASANRIWLWSITTGKPLHILESPWHYPYLSAAAFTADGKLLVSVNGDGILQLWDPETGKELRRIDTKGKSIEQAALSPDGETIALWDDKNPQTIALWNIRTGEKRRDIGVPPQAQSLYALRYSPDGKTLYACSGTDTRILRWDAVSGKGLPFIGKHDDGVNGITLSPDGRSLAALSLGGTLYLWETVTAQAQLIIKDVGYSTSVAFSSDGSLLALANSGNPRLFDGKEIVRGVENREQVRLVRVADGKVIHRLTGHIGGINCVSFSPDGHILASGGQDTTALLWDVTKLRKDAVKERASLNPEKLADLWNGLRGTAAEAHGCMWTLIAAPSQTVPFFGEKLKPIATVDAERFARLLKKLASDQFAQREEATQELKKMGDAIEPALRKAIQDKSTLETRLRLQALLDDLEGRERLHFLRAIEVLERIGDKPARDLLRRLSEGAAGAWMTEEARMSLRRLQQLD